MASPLEQKLAEAIKKANTKLAAERETFAKTLGKREEQIEKFAARLIPIADKLPMKLPKDFTHKGLFPSLYKKVIDLEQYKKENEAFIEFNQALNAFRDERMQVYIAACEEYAES